MQERIAEQVRTALVVCALAFAVLAGQKWAVTLSNDSEAPQVVAVQATYNPVTTLNNAICGTYRLDCTETASILKVVLEEAQHHQIPQALAVGLALRESGFRPHARSKTGDHGLLQVNYRWHRQKVAKLKELYDVRTNTRIGYSYLRGLLARADGNVYQALRYYNGASSKSAYPDEVLERTRWVAQYI